MGKGKSFRIVTSSKNKLVSVNPGLKTQTERYISGQTKLRADRGAGEQEFWFLSRSEGNSYFMRRLSKHASYGKLLKKGELHPEIAYMMSFLAEPCANDLILDPFCGYGAIVEQLLKHFKCGCVYAADIDEAVLQSTIKKAKQYPEAKHEIFNCDVRQLIPKAGKESIDRIITDPPWGIYEMIADIKSFYREFLGIFTSLLKPRGIMVILTAQKEALLEALDETKAFTIAERHDILVSGKKSAIFKLVKG
jgi:tRNA G10  N-methylase Trm11